MTTTEAPGSGRLEAEIAFLAVPAGSAACVWLGQGGYLFKSPGGVVVMVDAYLSDYAEAFWGVTRAMPPVVDPARITPDVFLVTYWHEDHLDAPTVRHYARQPNVVFAGPESCVIRAQIWGWPAERAVTLERGDSHTFGDVEVTATFARHDEDAALTLDVGGVRIWDVADSEYDARLRPMRDARIDVMLVRINGVGANMDAHEAALLTWHVAPRIAVPMHYGMWPDEQYGAGAKLDPETFRETFARLGGTAEVRVLTPGEVVFFPAR